MKQRILFIVNPISGGFNKVFMPSLIDRHLNHQKFDAKIIYTLYHGHAVELAKEAVAGDTDIVVAVGGDGTINEVAGALESSNKIMGIVPCGSGNGLARTLGIPLDNAQSISRINCLNATAIDVGVLNDKKFFNMAGMGFDAHISAHFATSVKRGFLGYIKSTLKEVSAYKAQKYTIVIDGKEMEKEAFMLSLANSSQYGNNAHISATASTQDGLLDICIIKPFPLSLFPLLGLRMFTKTTGTSKYVEIIKASDFKIYRSSEGPVHVDGEPLLMGKQLSISVKPLALKIIN